MKYNNIKLCNNINYLCEKNKMPKGELEDIIGVSRGYLSRLSAKDRVPGIDKIEEIADHFKVSIDTLLHDDLIEENEIDNVVLLQCLLNKMIMDTNNGDIIWHRGAGAESDLLNLKTPGVNLMDTCYMPEDLENEGSFVEGEGKYLGILYKGVISNGDYFLLVQIASRDEKGWLLYVYQKRMVEHYDEEIGHFVREEEHSNKIFNTLFCHERKLDEVTEKLLVSIEKRMKDAYLDWGTKAWINNYLGN